MLATQYMFNKATVVKSFRRSHHIMINMLKDKLDLDLELD